VRKSFDDYEKKKIIAESVRTSSVDFSSEGSGLWPGRFVRPSLCAWFRCAGSILDPVFDSIINSGFASSVSSVVNSGFDYSDFAEEHCAEEKHCNEKEQLSCGNAGEADAKISSLATHA